MKRFKTLSESKFNTLTGKDMTTVVGGFLCISCKKRARAIRVELVPLEPAPGTQAWRDKQATEIR